FPRRCTPLRGPVAARLRARQLHAPPAFFKPHLERQQWPIDRATSKTEISETNRTASGSAGPGRSKDRNATTSASRSSATHAHASARDADIACASRELVRATRRVQRACSCDRAPRDA